MTRKTLATIKLASLKANLHALQAKAPSSKTLAVVKADAYGNGAIEVARYIEADVDMFAVAIVDEALALRKVGIHAPILVLQGPHESSELSYTFSHNLHWMMHNQQQIEWLSNSNNCDENWGAHLWWKFDTGMHRLGFAIEDFHALLKKHAKYINQHSVIATHLACADENDTAHTTQQIDRFLEQVAQASMPLSIANSAGTIAHHNARQAYNRLGIALYGSSPFEADNTQMTLLPVMSLSAHIIALRSIPTGDSVGYGATWVAARPSIIATVAIGYADGYPRHAPIGTPAICRQQRISLVGRVSMDMLTFDVTDAEAVKIGDKVELWGEQLAINEVAEWAGTIGYELMTRVSARVPRHYEYGPEPASKKER
ncbi:alanine racemase [Glaciecola sp. SC05]|uniref:alanine racemase n=1 Tax=Glaciecola sp. SC05 TaxID=1987355 RepID=UPI003526E21D